MRWPFWPLAVNLAASFDEVFLCDGVFSLVFWRLEPMVVGHSCCKVDIAPGRFFGYRIVGGIIMAPLIGILIARLSSPLQNKPRWVQIAGSLLPLRRGRVFRHRHGLRFARSRS